MPEGGEPVVSPPSLCLLFAMVGCVQGKGTHDGKVGREGVSVLLIDVCGTVSFSKLRTGKQ